MIKKYYSKYTGKQIDEAVAALIENNVKIEDLNQEVVELINSKANEGDLAALKEEVNNEFKTSLEKIVGNISEPMIVPTSGRIEKIYISKYKKDIETNTYILEPDFLEAIKKLDFDGSNMYNIFQTATHSLYFQGVYNNEQLEDIQLIYSYRDDTGVSFYHGVNNIVIEVNEDIFRGGKDNTLLLKWIYMFTGEKGEIGQLEEKVEKTTIQSVFLPINFITNAINSYYSETEFDLTEEEIELFDNSSQKIYIGAIPNDTSFAIFTPVIRGLLGDDSKNTIILYGGEFFMLTVDLARRKGRLNQTIHSTDYDYLQERLTTTEEEISLINTTIGDMSTLLDDINGEVI